MQGGPLARVNTGADVLGGRGDIFHDGKWMDRDAAGRARRVRFVLYRHEEVRRERKRTWAMMQRAHRPSDKKGGGGNNKVGGR